MPVASQRGQLPGQRNIRATRMCYGVEQVLDRPSITDEHKDRVEERQRDFVIAPRGVRARSSIESALTAGEKAGEERRGEGEKEGGGGGATRRCVFPLDPYDHGFL